MIYEFRTYTLKPRTLKTFLQRFGDALPPRLEMSPLAAFWYTDIGPLNQVVHMWAFEDLADRAARRAKMAADPGWAVYLAAATPFLVSMENKIVSPTSFFDLDALAKNAPYNK